MNAFATAGIVNGKGNGLFEPNESASRAESVAIDTRKPTISGRLFDCRC
ncbi:S-layer homology domain-containing protein [Cohnella lupini]